MAKPPPTLKEMDHIPPLPLLGKIDLGIARSAGKPDHFSGVGVLRNNVVFRRPDTLHRFQRGQPFLERNRHHLVFRETFEMEVISQGFCAPNRCHEGHQQKRGERDSGFRHVTP